MTSRTLDSYEVTTVSFPRSVDNGLWSALVGESGTDGGARGLPEPTGLATVTGMFEYDGANTDDLFDPPPAA